MVNHSRSKQELIDELRESEDLCNYYQKEYDKAKKKIEDFENSLEGITRFEKRLGEVLTNELREHTTNQVSIATCIFIVGVMISCAIIWGI